MLRMLRIWSLAVSQDQDFDFKVGRGHYRGRGSRGLIALAIVQLPRALLLSGGIAIVPPATAWLVHLLHMFTGH